MRIVGLCLVLLLIGCATPQQDVPVEQPVKEVSEEELVVDVTDDGKADMKVSKEEDTVEVTLDFDEVTDVPQVDASEFCVAGSTYDYKSEDGTIKADVKGLTTYKGKQFCEAHASHVINSPAGEIRSETTYYFDNTYKEYWIVTTTSGSMMPAQTQEMHLVDGKVA